MDIKIVRDTFTADTTIGKMHIDGAEFCDTLEDTFRNLNDGGVKVQNVTAIPKGEYSCSLRYSPHLKHWVLWLQDVPGFTYVYIHFGNYARDTDGCILIGYGRMKDMVTDSDNAFRAFMKKVLAAVSADEEITVTVA